MEYWLLLLVPVATVAVVVMLMRFGRRPLPFPQARHRFLQQREHLEAEFFQAASTSGKPRGVLWKECDWGEAIEFARDKNTNQYVALVEVTIAFEAVEGGDMEGVAAVGNLRNASAVFAFDGALWRTRGRAVFNLNPDEALRHFSKEYERIDA